MNETLSNKLQEGIFYNRKPFKANKIYTKVHSNQSFAILFLKIVRSDNSDKINRVLTNLWEMYNNLKSGTIDNLSNHPFPSGNLSVLISFGSNVFNIEYITKKIPRDFKDKQFLPFEKGSPIANGSGLKYSYELGENVGLSEDVAIQFISHTQLAVYRAIVETKRFLDNESNNALILTKTYTGFQRDDGRSWIGFHDEVSNMANPKERLNAIVIDRRNNRLIPRDFWTIGGTYLAFLRIEINLDIWNKIERRNQELMVGRDKLTGVPLIGVDKNGNPILKENCNTAYDVQGFKRDFHEHPDYFKSPISNRINSDIDLHASSQLNQSHIGRTRHIDNIDSKYPDSRRIYRQGFEFFESLLNIPNKPFRVGLNFISFQNDPSRLFFILTHPDWMGKSNFGGHSNKGMHKLFSVISSGVFFVPPINDIFPGTELFT
ncbi:MAG: Dyp-type peroxidase [Nitrososphaeraceae archaeon]